MVVKWLGKILYITSKFINRAIKGYQKTLFKAVGSNVYIGNNCIITYNTVSLGNHVSIGSNCVIQSTHGAIQIGNHVMFGPGVHIHGGNHIISKSCVYMDDITKEAGTDPKVVIQDDVWIGANALILKGVTVGEGSVVGAGSVVTSDVEPCSVVAGIPAKKIRMRFSEQEVTEHRCFIGAHKNIL